MGGKGRKRVGNGKGKEKEGEGDDQGVAWGGEEGGGTKNAKTLEI